MINSILESEAGMMLLAEEFDFLANTQTLRVLLALSQKGPLAQKEILKLGLGKPYRIKATLKYLMDEGKIVRVKRIFKSKKPRTPPKNFYHYFMADEFIACALSELMNVLQRSHQDYADSFERLSRELKPVL